MRVAMLAPVAWRTPPRHYGPWELVTSLLTEGLVARGIDVTLFATRDSVTAAHLEGVCARGYADDPAVDGRVSEALHVSYALSRSADFDIMHNQMDWLPLAFSAHSHAPMITTIHGFSGPGILPAYRQATSAFVAISEADRVDELTYAATIHHGVDTDALQLNEVGGEHLVYFGWIHPDKGTADAIEIARRSGRRLVIAGIVQDEKYFAEQVSPHIDGDRVVFLGPVDSGQRSDVLGGAGVLLHPIHFDEPFGLSVVEAMVCGTPVVAYRRGSMAEVVDEGVTGHLVHDVGSAVTALAAAVGLDRVQVRRRAVQRFGVARMVDEYVSAYEALLSEGEQIVEVDVGDLDPRVADPVRDPEVVLVPEGPARVDDVGDVALDAVGRRGQHRPLRTGQDPAGVVEIEQQDAHAVHPHRSDPVGQHEPAVLGLDGRPAVADLKQLPRLA